MERKVFLVDDEEPVLKSLTRELSEWGRENNIIFRTFTNPLDVMEALRNDKEVFLVISDLRMPGMFGSDLLMNIHEEYPEIVTILLTGYSEIEEIMKAIKAGIFSYILKPWDEKYLLTEVHKALELYILKEDRRKYIEMLNEELKWGGELQKTLLVRDLPSSDRVDFYAEYQPLPMLYCGGDYYDVIPLDYGRYLVLLGDVAGHGLKAAFITTILKTVIYSGYIRNHRSDADFSPAGFLIWLNNRISRELSKFPDVLITFVAMLVDADRGEIIFSNAGQQNFFLVRDGRYYPVFKEGICLNITDKPIYKNVRVKIKPDDMFFLFTDGLTEITEDRTALPEKEVGRILVECEAEGLPVSSVVNRFRLISSEGKFHDDVTLLAVRVKK